MVAVKTYIKLLSIAFILSSQFLLAQNAPFATISVNKGEVYVSEPVKITVTVFTPTYFTAPANFENIQIQGAFTVFFKSEPTSKTFNGKQFSGIKKTYNVFPYEAKNLVIPPFNVKITTPGSDGGYKGVEMRLSTKERKIKVKDVPENFDSNEWLVANNVRVSESWAGNTKEVKVGDVLSRNVERTVYGTVGELVHPIIWDSIPNTSLYPTRSTIENIKSETAISAKRTEGVRYLFEKEGTYIIPEKEITWWNPVRNRLYKKTLSGLTVVVKANPDLGMVTSMKDSLDSLNQRIKKEQTTQEEEKEELTILGLSLRDFLIALIICAFIVYYSVKFLKKQYKKYKTKREKFLKSELYFFMKFLKSISTQRTDSILNAMYQWISKLDIEQPTMHALNDYLRYKSLGKEIDAIETQLKSPNKLLVLNKKIWMKSRKRYLEKKKRPAVSSDWINPQTIDN